MTANITELTSHPGFFQVTSTSCVAYVANFAPVMVPLWLVGCDPGSTADDPEGSGTVRWGEGETLAAALADWAKRWRSA